MNENFQQRLIAYLDRIESTVNASTEFVASQAPDVAQQYLAWVFWVSSVLGVVFIAVSIAFLLFAKSCRDNEGCAISVIISVVAFVPAACCITEAIKVCVAPKVVILEKVSELAREVTK